MENAHAQATRWVVARDYWGETPAASSTKSEKNNLHLRQGGKIERIGNFQRILKRRQVLK